MKKLLVTLFIFQVLTCISQETLIPFRVKDKFGLSNLKGKIKVKPSYDKILLMGNNYFSYINYENTKDTIHTWKGTTRIEDKIIEKTGVLHNNSKLIQDQKYGTYQVIEDVILASESTYHIESAMLFSLEGVALFNKDIDNFQAWNPQYENGKITQNLLIVKHMDRTYELSVYDVINTKITKRILENLKSLDVSSDRYAPILEFTYSDENGYYQNGYIYVENNEYVFSNTYPYNYKRQNNHQTSAVRLHNSSPNSHVNLGSLKSKKPTVPLTDIKEKVKKPVLREQPKKSKPIEFSLSKENVVLQNGQPIEGISDLDIEFIYKKKFQKSPLIFSNKKGKKGLIFSKDKISETTYDHLQYIKNQHGITIYDMRYYYLVGNKINGKMQYGILNKFGEIIVPIMYDKIQTNMMETYWKSSFNSEEESMIDLKEGNYHDSSKTHILYYGSSGFLDSNKGFMVAYKNGKCGLIDINNTEYLPFDYDEIFKNGLGFSRSSNFELEDKFIILKKNNKYGIIMFNGKKEITKFVEPIFPAIPSRFYKNFNQVEGLVIFGLSKGSEAYYCYANENGKIYMK